MDNWRLQQEAWWKLANEDQAELDDLGVMLVAKGSLGGTEISHKKKRGGSRPGRRPNLARNRALGAERIYADYFADNPVYDEKQFRHRYRMSKNLFLRIQGKLLAHDPYFHQKSDALGVPGLTTLQKTTTAIRMLAYGMAVDSTDEHCRVGDSTATKAMKRYCEALVAVFGPEFLRLPTKQDITKQLMANETRGLRGMFGSLACRHWTWKNCSTACQGVFHERSIILEAVADPSLRIWHAYFGLPGSNNDINVIDRSPLISNLLRGETSAVPYTINGNQYERCYLLTDDIYPKLSCFVQTIHDPPDEKLQWFALSQEAAHKDVERSFCVLQARFAVVRNPSRLWDQETIWTVMHACIILHNMIIEDEKDDPTLTHDYLFECEQLPELKKNMSFDGLMRDTMEIEDSAAHCRLQNDLVEHLWTSSSLL